MQYKYKKIVTEGAFGSTIGHRSSDEKSVITLGEIDGYTYIYATDLSEQHDELVFEEIVLTKDELAKLSSQMHIKCMSANYDSKAKNLVAKYPEFEVDTFGIQEAEAKAFLADANNTTPFLDVLCESRSEDKTVLANKIVSNANALRIEIANILGEFQKITKAI